MLLEAEGAAGGGGVEAMAPGRVPLTSPYKGL